MKLRFPIELTRLYAEKREILSSCHIGAEQSISRRQPTMRLSKKLRIR